MYTAAVLFFLFLSIECAGYYLAAQSGSSVGSVPASDKGIDSGNENISLKKKIASYKPRGNYIIVDTARNILYIKDGDKTLLKAVISSGSGNVLTDPAGNRTWTFDTPRGEHSVKSKIVNPDWIKPDWAFVEEGVAIPDKFNDRVESGVLGKYALAIGNGYLIHGTLYTRMLGRNVTHGCVRVGDNDLEFLYKNTPIGTKVIIF